MTAEPIEMSPDVADEAPPDPMSYDRMVVKLALRYGADRRRPRESLQYSDGWIGLMDAVRRFDPSRRLAFITYAHAYVSGYIMRGISQRVGRPGSRRHAARFVTFSDLERAEGSRRLDLAVTIEPDPAIEGGEVAEEVARLLSALPDRERSVIEARVFDGLKFDEVAIRDGKGHSKQRMQQVYAKGLEMLRGGG